MHSSPPELLDFILRSLLEPGQITGDGGKVTVACIWIGMLAATTGIWWTYGPEHFWSNLAVTIIFLVPTYVSTWAISKMWD